MNDRANAGRGARSAATVPTLLQSACDRLAVGFALFDPAFRLAAWNARFAALRGYPRKLVKAGTALESFVRFDAERGEYGAGAVDALTRDRLATLKRRRRAEREQPLPDGRVVRIATERVPEGGLLVTCEDVTDESRAAQRLRESEGQRKLAEIELRCARDAATTALAEQTALREVLEAISRSAFDLDAVLRTLVESATRLCRADKGFIFRLEGDVYRLAVDYGGVSPEFRDFEARHPMRPGRETLIGRTALEKRTVHIEDILADREYRFAESQRIGGFRTILGVPILRDDIVIGVMAMWKERVEPFTPAQIQLVTTFSSQASIAIENARLFGETKEALERQTATSEILQAIARSPTDLQEVLDTVVRNAARLCEADNASLFRVEGDSMRLVVRHGSVRGSLAVGEARPISRGSMSGRAILDRKTINVPDFLELELATEYPDIKTAVESSGIRTCLATPLVCEGVPIGALTIYRTEVRPYSASQIELVKLFADQAVIAIENVRLFKELEARNRELIESLEQQTATAEILKVISSSPTEIQPVLDAVATTAARLCDASDAVIFRIEGDQLMRAAKHGESIPAVAFGEGLPLDRTTVNGRAAVDRRTIHVHDLAAVDEAEYPLGREYAIRDGFRTALATPLLREGQALGTIHIRRTDVRPFSGRQIKLLEIFASQAAIAIENVRLFNETKEALERQTATAQILKIISSSPTDVQPVFDAIVESGVRLFGGVAVTLRLVKGEGLERAAFAAGLASELTDDFATTPFALDDRSITGRAVMRREVIHAADVFDQDWLGEEPRRAFERMGARAAAAAPLLREAEVLGALMVSRAKSAPFTDKEIALLRTFADQAVIAIENVRLFNELQTRNRELTEALEQQTATAEILKVISNSPTDVQPVFDAIVRAAVRLCDGRLSTVLRFDGEVLDLAAHHNLGAEGLEAYRRAYPRRVGRDTVAGRAILERAVINLADSQDEADAPPQSRAMAAAAGFLGVLVVPMLREGEPIGVVNVARAEPGPFSQAHVDLLKTFADQAVIAIENVRLFNETKEALEQQTATAEILRVISSSPNDLAPVFDAVAKSVSRLCDAPDVVIVRAEGDAMRFAASVGPFGQTFGPEFAIPISHGSVAGRAVLERRTIQIHDLAAELEDEYPDGKALQRRYGHRTMVAAPLLLGSIALGAIGMLRKEVRPFSEKQIALLRTFADQAVIAIENVRLFNETKEALEQQTATAEILRVLSGSPTDTQPVFDAILQKATALCDADTGALLSYDGAAYHALALRIPDPAFAVVMAKPRQPGSMTGLGRLARERRAVHIPNLLDDDAYRNREPTRMEAVEIGGMRTWVGVPMLKDGEVVGAIMAYRKEVRPFDERQIALLQTFADQAVIAIENVRLFNETKEALERQTATAEILKVISSSPTDVQPVFDAIVAHAGRIAGGCSVNVSRLVGDQFHLAAYTRISPEADDALERAYPFSLGEVPPLAEAVRRKAPFFVGDWETDPDVSRKSRDVMRARGYRSTLYVPIVRGDRVYGVMHVSKLEPGPFPDQWVNMLRIFADQAVIAIENVRLFNETKEALDQQKASAEVLQVISSSVADTKPVFDKILESCERLFAGLYVGINVVGEDGLVHLAEFHGRNREEFEKLFPTTVTMESGTGAAILLRQVMHYPDTLRGEGVPDFVRRACQVNGARAVIVAPMLWEDRGIGAIYVARDVVGPFAETEIALLKTFADQAVIAIQNTRLFNETKEALEQQTATAEILKVISASPTDVQPVFDAIATSGVRLFQGVAVSVRLVKGDQIERVAFAAAPGCEVTEDSINTSFALDDRSFAGRVVLRGEVVHVADVRAADWIGEMSRTAAERMGVRAIAAAPMLREGRALGSIGVTRARPGPFSDKELALLRTFADQAVIAIQNARLFNETKEALERQTATAEILRVISVSPTDVQPVFDAIVKSGVHLFRGVAVTLRLVKGDRIERAAFAASPDCEVTDDLAKPPFPLDERSITGRAVLRRELVHVADVFAEEWVGELSRQIAERMGWRAVACAPLLREGDALGAIMVTRARPAPFGDKEIALLRTFADQAVIAIENVRLFNETKEALDHQRASAEVLQVISSSVADAKPVFEKILESCERLFVGKTVGVSLVGEDGAIHLSAYHGPNREEMMRNFPVPLNESSGAGTAILQRRVVQYPDTEVEGVPDSVRRGTRIRGDRSAFHAPMLWEGRGIGSIFVSRPSVGAFSEKEIALLKTFADQAVIAIQNARLFNETKEALDHQKASAEILQVISSSVADAKPVFEKILESCERLFVGKTVGVSLVGEDGLIHVVAYHGPHAQGFSVPLTEASASGSAILQRRVMHYPDVEAPGVPDYARRGSTARGDKALLVAPMLWEGRGIGVVFVGRSTVGEFSEKEIALLKTFADQAVIAIQNAKLFHEIQEKSHQLEIANQHKSTFLANMSHELRTPLNAVIGFSEMLNARYFGDLTAKQAEYVNDIHGSGKHLLSLINDILDLSKIEAGRMELEVSEFDLRAALDNALTLVRERAQRGGVALRLDADPALGLFEGDERKLKQVVLNLLSNAVKFTPRGGAVNVAAKRIDGAAEIAVSDTGVGIAPADQEAIFEAFRQVGTDVTRKREGTGLGLALARRFVELHGGTIRVESAPGKGSTFTVTLPLRHGE